MIERKTGVAIPLSALRNEDSPVIGEFSSLIAFADFAKKAGLSIIQLLPVLDTGAQSSPYSSLSAFALHPIYIQLSDTIEFENCLDRDAQFKNLYEDFLSHKNDARFDYEYILNTKEFLLRKIWTATIFRGGNIITNARSELYSFIEKNIDWIPFYCVYKYLKQQYQQASWKSWKKEHRKISKDGILAIWNNENIQPSIIFYAWEQYIAFNQFKRASDYIKSLGITLKGDLPILLNEDSCDVWAFPELFNQKMKAGSPPDGDNPSGQNWGFPCYDFENQEKDGFAWWRRRISLASQYFGAYRLDHIPGFFRLWSIPDGESTAELGHTEPYSAITENQLIKAGFSKERIRWLSQPHLPTEDFIRLIGNPDSTREILGLLCDRIGREELWLFKSSVKSEADIRKINLDQYNIDESIQVEIFNRLCRWWRNRTLIEISKNKFLPLWKYGETRAWNTLSEEEKSILTELFTKNSKKQEKSWQEQAEKIFTALKNESDMVICGEDLGVFIPCMEKVLDKFNILGLKVFRWCKNWDKEDQPFQDVHTFRRLSVVTSSVHDSSTLREWYDKELKRILIDIPHSCSDFFIDDSRKSERNYFLIEKNSPNFSEKFDPKSAESHLSIFAESSGAWFIPPLQDWLYLDSKYYADDPQKERINIPGTVSKFNWTWRMGMNIEELSSDSNLISKIRKIAEKHDKLELN